MVRTRRDDFEEHIARWEKRARLRRDLVDKALAVSPAMILSSPATDHLRPFRQLVIVSRDTHPDPSGPIRISEFLPDGPWGHRNVKDMDAAADEIGKMLWKKLTVAYDPDVIAWTSTPEFTRGVHVAALMQADNAIRYRMSKLPRTVHIRGFDRDEFDELMRSESRRAHDMFERDPEGAVKILESWLKEIPTENPMRSNPEWVNNIIAINYDVLEKNVMPSMLPRLDDVRPGPRGAIMAELHELGCGGYGCVLPTLDKGIVLKVTTDTTEAEFASEHANDLVAPICVRYHLVMRLAAKYKGNRVFLLWRDAADEVGTLRHALGDRAYDKIQQQHWLAQVAYDALYKGKAPKVVAAAIDDWLEYLAAAGVDPTVPEPLRTFFLGMHDVYMKQHVLFGDVHAENIALVKGKWVIIDPGNVAVVD